MLTLTSKEDLRIILTKLLIYWNKNPYLTLAEEPKPSACTYL